jgi:radical SAM protein with 4Fe4S-binding SPASM domain
MDRVIKYIELHFSNLCSNNCVICSKSHGGDSQPFITEDVVDAIIDNLYDINYTSLQVGGDGDSFLSKLFIPSLQRFKKVFPTGKITLFTNGRGLSPDISMTIINERLLDEIQIRLDSLNPVVYSQSTGRDYLKLILDNIEFFRKHNNFILFVIIYFPLYLYRQACKNRINKDMPTYWKNIDESLLYDEYQEFQRYFNVESANKNLFRVRNSQIGLWGEREDIPPYFQAQCPQLPENDGAFKNQIYIYPNGNIGLCPYDDEQNTFIIGNILKDRLIDVWNGEQRQQIINDVRNGKYLGKYPCTDPRTCVMKFGA